MSPTQREMLGFVDEKKVPVEVRKLESMRRLVWRMKVCWGFVENEALALLATCRHVDGCPGVQSKEEPCRPDCPDRQTRMSALVFWNNAREFARVEAYRPAGGTYIAPTREYFDALLGELVSTQVALEEMIRNHEATAELPPTEDSNATET